MDKTRKWKRQKIDILPYGVKRKLTREEAKEVTEEVMNMNFKNPDTRFNMAIIKSIDKINTNPQKEDA